MYIHGKAHTERCASYKGKVEVWCQYHIIRVEKYVDTNIQIFSPLMRSDIKNINRKVLRRFCMGRIFETLRQEKKFKMVLFGLSENNCHGYWFGSMWEIFKMESFKLYILKKVPKFDIIKLNLKITIGYRAKWSM